MLAEGQFFATIVGGAIQVEADSVQIGVQLAVKNSQEKIWWYGDLAGDRANKVIETKQGTTTPKAIAFKNLATFGLNDSKLMDMSGENSRFDSSFFIDPKKEFEITVSHFTGKDGKTRAQVRYINEAGGGKFGKIAPSVAKSALSKLNFQAEIAAARANLGILPVQATTEPAPPSFDSEESIPF